MGDRDHRAGVLLEVALEPLDGLGVEVVGWLVPQQQLAQRDPALLAAGQHRDIGVSGRAAQSVHRLLELRVEVPRLAVVELLLQVAHLGQERVVVGVGVGQLGRDLVEPVEQPLGLGDAVLDVLQDRTRLVELRLLLEEPDRVARRERGLAVRWRVQTGHDAQHARLAGAVGADDADLGARQERQGHVVEDDLVAVRFARLVHRVDELRHGSRA